MALSMYGFGGTKRAAGKNAKRTSKDPMPSRQRGRPDPQLDRKTSVGVDYGTDISRQGTPRSYDEIAKSSGRPKTDHDLIRNRGAKSAQT